MESIINRLTRASLGAAEPTKATLISAATELRKLKTATSGILEEVQVEEQDEASLTEFVRNLDIISSVAEEPLQTWLRGIGKALLVLGDALDMPPPPPRLPKVQQEFRVKGMANLDAIAGLSTFPSGPSVEKGQSPLNGAYEPAEAAVALRFEDGMSGHSKAEVRLPWFPATGSREAPIEIADTVTIKCEPEEEELPSAVEELRESTQTVMALPFGCDDHGRAVVHLPGCLTNGRREDPVAVSSPLTIGCKPAADEGDTLSESSLEAGELREPVRIPSSLHVDRANSAIPLDSILAEPSNLGTRQQHGTPAQWGEANVAKPSRCFKCGRQFPSRTSMNKHRRAEHDNRDLPPHHKRSASDLSQSGREPLQKRGRTASEHFRSLYRSASRFANPGISRI